MHDGRLDGVDHVEVGDGVHPHRHVVLRDDVLRRDVHRDGLQVDPHHPVDDRDDEEQARTLGRRSPGPAGRSRHARTRARSARRRQDQHQDATAAPITVEQSVLMTLSFLDRRCSDGSRRRLDDETEPVHARPRGCRWPGRSEPGGRALPPGSLDDTCTWSPSTPLTTPRARRSRGPADPDGACAVPAMRAVPSTKRTGARRQRDRHEHGRVDLDAALGTGTGRPGRGRRAPGREHPDPRDEQLGDEQARRRATSRTRPATLTGSTDEAVNASNRRIAPVIATARRSPGWPARR